MLHHAQWAREKHATFIGRQWLVEKALEIINASKSNSPPHSHLNQSTTPFTIPTTASVTNCTSQKSETSHSSNITLPFLIIPEKENDKSSVLSGSSNNSPLNSARSRSRTASGSMFVPSPLDGLTLSIIGKSGSGKTSLMAKLAYELHKRETESAHPRPVIIRFCGTSRTSGWIDLSG